MNRHRGRIAATLGAVTALATAAGAYATSSAPAGSLHQAPGKNGCYTEDGQNGCHTVRGATGADSLAISPDGRFAYIDGYGGNGTSALPALAALKRNPKTGTLSQLPGKSGCFSRDGGSEDGPNTCTKARDLGSGDATSVAIASDGRFLYVASQLRSGTNVDIGGVAVFARNLKTGKLRQLKGTSGCVTAVSYKGCAIVREVEEVSNLKFTPDHKYLYASDYNGAPHSGIAIFKVNPKNGMLHQLKGVNGCISTDGTTAASGTTKVCRAAANLNSPWDVVTPDNRFAYVPAAGAFDLVQGFERNSQGGLVALKGKGGCVSDSGSSPAGACVNGRGLSNPERALASPNGRYLYIGSYDSPSPVAVLNRNPKNGMLSQRSGTAACISLDGTSGDGETCRNGRALHGEYAGGMAPDGRTFYFPEFSSNALTIFRVSPKTGAFFQLPGKFGCVTPDGSSEEGAGTCETGRVTQGAYQVALGSQGRDVYLSAQQSNGEALFYAHK